MGCHLPGHICTDHFRFKRQLMNILAKVVPFSGLLFREQPSEPFREESIESAVHEPSSDRNWWSAGQEKNIFLIVLLHCGND